MLNQLWIFHSSDELYGSDRVLLQIVEALDLSKWQVCVILPADLPYQTVLSSRLSELSVRVQKRPLAVLRRRYQNLPGLLKLGWLLLCSVPFLAWEMRRQRVTLVYTNTGVVLSGAIAAKFAGINHIWGLKEFLPAGHLKAGLARLYCWFSQTITVTSQAVCANLTSIYPPCEPKTKIIYNAVDTQRFQPDAALRSKVRAEFELEPDTLVCAMLGRVAQSKGPEVFIAAAQLLHQKFPAAQFWIVGGPIPGKEDYLTELQTRVQTLSLGDTVRFLDFQSDVALLLKAIDVVVMPSLRPEGFGLTLIEAMATGLAVVASKHGGPLETVVPDQTGLLYFPPDAVQALADALTTLLTDPALRARLGHSGRDRAVQFFSRSVEAQAYRQLFDGAVKHK